MLEDTMTDMDSDEGTALTDEQVARYGSMNPFIIYLEGGENVKNKKVCAALIEGVHTSINGTQLKVRKQGTRKGMLGYNAKATIPARRLVPVFALVEESLVDAMLISPAALALGMAAINACSAPNCMDLVDALVEDYEESAPIEREFFNPQYPDVDTVAPNLSSGTWSGQVVMPDAMYGTTYLNTVVDLEPGTVADGPVLDFNPQVHVIP